MGEATLRSRHVTKEYGGDFRLGPLDFVLTPGVTCLVGPNGAGKSTLFRIAAGVDACSDGALTVEGAHGRAPAIGYLPQTPQLPGTATCEQFLNYVAWLHRVPKADRGDAVTAALHLTRLTDQRAKRIRKLSGGMARRLGIAHALVHRPGVLLLDEPTVGLDPRQRLSLRETISELGRERVVLVSTHLIEDVRGLADRVLVLDEGQLVFDGAVEAIEAKAEPGAPGDTDLERGLASLLGGE